MIKFLKQTPLYFHLLFLTLFLLVESCFFFIYKTASYLKPSYEEYILYNGVLCVVFLSMYVSVVHYFYQHSRANKVDLFKTIEQNNIEYYVPYDANLSRKYLNETVIEQYNQMAETFMKMMREEQNRLDTTISYIHDMKLPLTTLAIILSKIEPQISYTDYLTAQASIERCNKYISEQLYMSQLTDLTNNLYFEEVDLNELWHEVIKELQGSIMMKKLNIKKEGKATFIRTDRRMLQFICMQLLQNAIQYTSENGDVFVSIEENGCYIKDNGVGIPDYELPLIFKRGYTGKVYRKQKQSGMGLYLVQRLTTVLDINIQVESKEHVGTTFSLYFEK